ncbi:MAG: ABC transporter ATP-binding protein, partial [Sphaerochaetaceae bacterium]
IQEGLETVQEMRSYNMEDEYLDSFSNTIKRNERYQIKSELLTGTFINVAYIFLKLGLATVVITGALLLRSSSIDLLTYMMFCLISAHIYNPITEILNNMAVLFYLDVRINRVKAMEAMTTQAGSTEFTPENFTIEFDHVDFSYEEGKQVLTDVSFCAPQGKVTALVGPSGGGKSTAAKLAARFWDIDSGKITLGGVDISTIEPETLLNYYSVVFQDVVLFNASIADNIRIGKKEATDREVMEAARLSQCHEFIQRLPDGYDTVIGENGETLSGGERQRISIARALLKNAPIVLLDEATASVDVENETKIQSGLSNLIRNRTLIIIAHRMRTIRHADNIVVLDGGKVVECGTPQQLGEKNGMFSKMAEIQKLL